MRKSILILILAAVTALPARTDLSKVSADLLKNYGDLKGKKLLVMPFEDFKRPTSKWGGELSRELIRELERVKGLSVLENSLVMAELSEITSAGKMPDQKAIQKIGRRLNADLLVVGTIIDQTKEFSRVNVRIVELETFIVVAAASQTIRSVSPR